MTDTAQAQHTRLTRRNFAGFAAMMLLIEFIIVGMGAVDLLMIAPLGVTHIAALGLGDLISIPIFAFFIGLVHAYGSRLAIAEGKQELALRLPVLAGALVLVLVLYQLLGLAIGLGALPTLRAIGQAPEIVPAVAGYLGARLNGVIPAILASAIGVTLRMAGAKSLATALLAVGFGANIALNYAFLYTAARGLFESPEAAVATATVLAQSLMVPIGAWFLHGLFRKRQESFIRPRWTDVAAEFRSLAPTSAGIGARHVNDYISATVPILFIGTMGAGAIAATAVATKVYTLYCRIPQSCFEAALAFYGYSTHVTRVVRQWTLRTVTAYSGFTTAVTAVLAVVCSTWLIAPFASNGVDRTMAQIMFFAYMISMPAYFFDQLLARFLVVHQRGDVLFSVSLLTYVVAIPFAWYAVFVLDSAFLAIASRSVVFVLSGLFFWRVLRRSYWTEREPAIV